MVSGSEWLASTAQRVLPAACHLNAAACCPTRDLVALTSARSSGPSAGGGNDAKVSLYRTTGAADLVWEWSPAAAPQPPKLGGFGLKGKAKAGNGAEIQAVTWSPDGDFLTVAVLGAPSPKPNNTLNVLSLHSGKPALPPIALPQSAGRVTQLSWRVLNSRPDSHVDSYAATLILELPTLPKITRDAAAASGVAAPPTTGIFGAKNAMLQKEREKEAGRPLNLQESATVFPTLLPSDGIAPASASKQSQATSSSVLLVGDASGAVHLYLGGSVYLGTVQLESGSQVVGVAVLPSTSTATRLSVTTQSERVTLHRVALDLPPTLELITQQSTSLRSTIQHAFDALQEARALWDESRRIGKAWMARLADVSKTHAIVQTPVTQLLLLLMTGRPTIALTDFLSSKMNEKALNKWEGTTAQALEKLRLCTFMSVEPAIERAVLLLDELKAWSDWPDKFGAFGLEKHRHELVKAIELAKEIIRSSSRLEPIVLEEERCFVAFQSWLRYELEKLAQQEGSEVRPTARFHPVPVAHFIRRCLSETAISPFLDFGLGVTSIASNADLAAAQRWVDNIPLDGDQDDPDAESLEAMLRRMKEEVKGQADAELLEASQRSQQPPERRQNPTSVFHAPPPPATERPPRVGKPKEERPVSLPILLHLLAGIVANVMDCAIRRIGESAHATVNTTLDDFGEASLKQSLRSRLVVNRKKSTWVYRMALSSDEIRVSRELGSQDDAVSENAAAKLRTEAGEQIEVIDVDFFDDEEIVLAVRIAQRAGPSYALLSIRLDTFDFLNGQKAPHLKVLRSHTFSAQFPPEALAMNGEEGSRVVCVLAGEGRRLEVLRVPTSNKRQESRSMIVD